MFAAWAWPGMRLALVSAFFTAARLGFVSHLGDPFPGRVLSLSCPPLLHGSHDRGAEIRHRSPFRVSSCPLPWKRWFGELPSDPHSRRSGLLAGFKKTVNGSESPHHLEGSEDVSVQVELIVNQSWREGASTVSSVHGARANDRLLFFPESRTQEALKSGHFVDVLSILLRLQRICNHPGLVEPRLPESSYTAGPLQYRSASLILQALDGDSWKVRVRMTSVADAPCAPPGLGGGFPRSRSAFGNRPSSGLPLTHGLRLGSA